MPTTILTTGECVYKSKPMPLDRAAAFARCIEANATRFKSVEILPAPKDNFRVQFATFTNSAYQAEWDARTDRAATEGQEYIFWKDPDKNNWWCFNPKSGETYELTLFDCSCPDHEFRCRKAGLHCKHRQALQMQIDAGTISKTDKVTRTPAVAQQTASRPASVSMGAKNADAILRRSRLVRLTRRAFLALQEVGSSYVELQCAVVFNAEETEACRIVIDTLQRRFAKLEAALADETGLTRSEVFNSISYTWPLVPGLFQNINA